MLLGAAYLALQVLISFYKEAAGTTGRVKYAFAQFRVKSVYDKAHHRARGIELSFTHKILFK